MYKGLAHGHEVFIGRRLSGCIYGAGYFERGARKTRCFFLLILQQRRMDFLIVQTRREGSSGWALGAAGSCGVPVDLNNAGTRRPYFE